MIIDFNNTKNYCEAIFHIHQDDVEKVAIELFHYQFQNNSIYQRYCQALRVVPDQINTLHQIPFLPISFFKTHEVTTGNFTPAAVFESSGTTGTINSRHLVKDLGVYELSFLKAFRLFYGDPQQFCIIGLLPSYLERNNASLVYMVDRLIKESGHPQSGFYLNEYNKLHQTLLQNEKAGIQTLLIGVTFALMDFFSEYPMQLENTVIMETGGMKGRRAEMTKTELQHFLSQQSGVTKIHSEYGMTELLSQGYSFGDGLFNTPPWMRILLRAEDNPLETWSLDFTTQDHYRGVVNVIDLANIHSCAFIATEDRGKVYMNGHFEILGRMDNSDVRGCSQMVL